MSGEYYCCMSAFYTPLLQIINVAKNLLEESSILFLYQFFAGYNQNHTVHYRLARNGNMVWYNIHWQK